MSFDPLELLTIKQVADILHRTPAAIIRYIKDGRLRAIKHNSGRRSPSQWLITRYDLTDFIYSPTGFNNAIGKRSTSSPTKQAEPVHA
jgi:hypothetical protein